MLTRAAAIEAIAGGHFEVVVIGGGITGAGVALDAASRGYSVALLERDDYAVGTSSRSSKMVHGGLRYLQNFDLGLVREALLERQLLVRLAPHLVYPTPFLVAALGEDRRDRKVGIGLNMYDVMATTRAGRSRREKRESVRRPTSEDAYWSPGPPPDDRPRRGAGAGPGARLARPARRLPLLRLPDRRRAAGAHRARRGRALRRGDAERRRGGRGHRRAGRAPPGSPSSRPTRASGSRSAPTTSSTRPASGPTRSAPRWSRRRTCRGSRPAAAPTCCSTPPTCRWAAPPASSRRAKGG